jgi:hypothetical protein
MTSASYFISSISAYVKINSFGITANLAQFRTSMIICRHQQDHILDTNTFNTSTSFNIIIK